jgi:tyrosine-protein phosphatase OCA6
MVDPTVRGELTEVPHSAYPSLPLIPPFRYTIVEDGVIRGAHPTLKNYRFMRRLRLGTIVSLMPEELSSDIVQFCEAEKISLIYRRVEKYDDNRPLPMSAQLVGSVLSILIDTAMHPVFIHCRDGGHNTGLVVMCLRRLQLWTTQAIIDEHRRYTKGNESTYQELQFVEAFSGPVAIPARVPGWLWGGVCIRAHPSIQILLDKHVVEAQPEESVKSKAVSPKLSGSAPADRGTNARSPARGWLAETEEEDGDGHNDPWYRYLLRPSKSLKTEATRSVVSACIPYSQSLAGLSLAGLIMAPASSRADVREGSRFR